MIRFRSPYVVFRVFGRPISVGGTSRFTNEKKSPFRKTDKEYALAKKNGEIQLTNLVRLYAKIAAAEQGWEFTDQSVYVVVTIYTKLPRRFQGEEREAIIRDNVSVSTPIVHNSLRKYIKMLKGVLFKSEIQVACGLVIKKFTDNEEFVDILVGRPKNFEDMIYDIRNN